MTAKRIHNITALGSGYLVRTVSQTILGLVIARLLHVDDFAVVRTIAAYWLIMAVFGRLSMLAALVSLGSATDVADEQKAYGATAAVVTIAASLVVIVIVQCILQFTSFIPTAAASALSVISLVLPFGCLSEVYLGSLQARGKFILAGQLSILYGVAPLVLITLATWLFKLEGWIAGRVLVELTIFATLLFVCYDWVRPKYWCTDKLRKLMGFAKINFFSGVFSIGCATVDILILSQLTHNLTELGCYGLAIMIFRAGGFAPQAVAKVFVREIALATGRNESTAKLISLSLLNCLLVGLVGAAGLAVVIPYVLAALLDSSYAPASTFIVWLAPGFVACSIYICCQETFLALRKPAFALTVHGAGLMVLVSMLFATIPSYGVLGVVWSVTISYLVMVILSLYLLLPWLRDGDGAELVTQ